MDWESVENNTGCGWTAKRLAATLIAQCANDWCAECAGSAQSECMHAAARALVQGAGSRSAAGAEHGGLAEIVLMARHVERLLCELSGRAPEPWSTAMAVCAAGAADIAAAATAN